MNITFKDEAKCYRVKLFRRIILGFKMELLISISFSGEILQQELVFV